MKLGFKKILTVLIQIIQIPLNIVLALLYFILILPYYFVYKNSFQTKSISPDLNNPSQNNKPTSFWLDIKPADNSLESLRRQF